jgi:hypothetical protein
MPSIIIHLDPATLAPAASGIAVDVTTRRSFTRFSAPQLRIIYRLHIGLPIEVEDYGALVQAVQGLLLSIYDANP